MSIISGILDTASKALGLEDTTVGKLLSAAIETLSGAATGDVLSILDGAKKFAAAAGEAAGKVEYYEPPASAGAAPAGYAPSSTAPATVPSTPTATPSTRPAASGWDAQFANALTVLRDRFDLLDTAAGHGGRNGIINRDDLAAALQNPAMPADVRRACIFLLQNPAAWNRIDVGAGLGQVDGAIGLNDVLALLGGAAKPPTGTAPRLAPGAASTSVPAPASASAAAAQPAVSEFDRKYANAVKSLSDHFELIDRPCRGVSMGSSDPDGRITKAELKQALENPDLPQDLKDAIHFLLNNPAAFDCLDGAGGRGHVDGKIFRSDLRCELERVGKNAGPAPATAQAPSNPGGAAAAAAGPIPPTATAPQYTAPAPTPADATAPFTVNFGSGSTAGAHGSRYAGMSPEEIVNAILLGALNDLDGEMIDIARQLDSAQSAQASAEKGSNAEKQATSDINRLQFKLQQVAERRRQMFELVSNLANLSHEMARAAISNLGRA